MYQPRSPYVKVAPQKLLEDRFDFSTMEADFFRQYDSSYTIEAVMDYIERNMHDNMLRASDIVSDNPSIEEILYLIYAIVYAASDIDNRFVVNRLDEHVERGNYRFFDFTIERVGDL